MGNSHSIRSLAVLVYWSLDESFTFLMRRLVVHLCSSLSHFNPNSNPLLYSWIVERWSRSFSMKCWIIGVAEMVLLTSRNRLPPSFYHPSPTSTRNRMHQLKRCNLGYFVVLGCRHLGPPARTNLLGFTSDSAGGPLSNSSNLPVQCPSGEGRICWFSAIGIWMKVISI